MRGVLLRSLGVFGIGVAVLAGVLYYASTVDGRPPQVERIALTHHLGDDPSVALTTTSIEVEFSEAVVPRTAEAAFRIEPALDGSFSWVGRTMTFTPSDRLPLETAFAVSLQAVVRDRAGNAMVDPPDPFAFETVGHPTVVASQPEDGAEDVPLESAIVLDFSTLMDTASVEAALAVEPGVDLTATWSGERLTLTPVEPLAEGRRYTLRIASSARDAAGTPIERAYRLAFRTALSSLEAASFVPSDGIEGVALTSPIAVIFDRELDPESVEDGLLRVLPAVSGSLEVIPMQGAEGMRDPVARVLRFQPSSALEPNTTYTVTLSAGLLGADGARLATPLSWRFTTGAPLATLSNQVLFLSDRSGVANLWAMNPDGTGQRQLSAELSPVTSYAVAPDGRSYVVGDGAVLIRQEAEGGGRQLLTGSAVLEFDPSFAPDGSEFAFGRADAETGAGLGLWIRPADGGEARRIQLPEELRPAASPTPEPPSGSASAPILRAPRYSPDGAAIAFVDVSGRVGVVELPGGRLTTARFVATSPPAWLVDSTGVLLGGLPVGRIDPPAPGEPLPPLDPASLGLSEAQLESLELARLDRGATAADRLGEPGGASRPATSGDGRYLYVVVEPGTTDAAGVLRVTNHGGTSFPLAPSGNAPVSSAAFAPEPDAIVAARVGDGIWLVNAVSGRGTQLSDDGWLPRWLP